MTARAPGWRAARAASRGPDDGTGRAATVHADAQASDGWWFAFLFIGAHIPLALLMARPPADLATAHAVLVLTCGVVAAIAGRLDWVAWIIAYIAGAEVLWRMTDAQVNWEFGKFASAGIMLLAILRERRFKPPLLPFAYFVLLLPSAAMVLADRSWVDSRNQLSFNLSGPLALMACAWFFSVVRLSPSQSRRLIISAVGPIVAVATVAASTTFTATDISFSDASNFTASGGFGPNQVSGALGLGALLCLFHCIDHGASARVRVLMLAGVIWLSAQTALTFSRGGLYMAAGGAAVAGLIALGDYRLRTKLLPVAAVLLVLGNYFVLPYLDAFTGGALQTRYQDTNLTGRDRLIQADIALWKEHLMLGVGPGQGSSQRAAFFFDTSGAGLAAAPSRGIPAHTEFSRLLSEHGTFGLVALLILIVVGISSVHHAPDVRSRAFVAGLIAWSALFMFSYAMRIFAPSFAFGLSCAQFVREDEPLADAEDAVPKIRRRRRLVEGHPSAADLGLGTS